MRIAIAIFALCLVAGPCLAYEDHLWPEPSILGGTDYSPSYGEQIHATLKDAYNPNVVVRMVAEPASVITSSVPSEFAVGIAGKDNRNRPPYAVFAVMSYGGNATAVRCDADISQPLAERVIAAWRAMLLGTRYPGNEGLDGQTYDFYYGQRGVMSGQAWSPHEDSATGNLVALGMTMMDFCNKKPSVGEAQLDQVTARLEARLRVEP